MFWRLISLEEIIQIWIISSKDNNLQYLCKVYCKELGQFDAVWCTWKKVQWDYKLQHLKIVTNGHQYINTTEDEKFVFWINAHTPIEKESNQDWNTPIHLESNGPHIKVPLIFWFFIMIFYFCFYHQFWIKWLCIDIYWK